MINNESSRLGKVFTFLKANNPARQRPCTAPNKKIMLMTIRTIQYLQLYFLPAEILKHLKMYSKKIVVYLFSDAAHFQEKCSGLFDCYVLRVEKRVLPILNNPAV